MTDHIPPAGTLDSQRRDLKHFRAAAETAGDADAVKDIDEALDDNLRAKEALLRKEAAAIEAAAKARKAAAEASADDAGEAAKTPPKGRTAAAPKATADAQGK